MSTETPSRVRLLTLAVLVAVFAAGVASGAALVVGLRPPHGPPRPGDVPALRGIALDAGQRVRIDAIFQRHRPELEAVFRDGFPRVRAIEEQLNREVREVLTPPQQAEFDEHERHRPPPPPGLPPPP
jgi:Spy/CpxP family protein refolding chaperone